MTAVLRGKLANHPLAAAFAREVERVHRRYATEAILAFRLCPFLRDAETGFPRRVVLDIVEGMSFDDLQKSSGSAPAPWDSAPAASASPFDAPTGPPPAPPDQPFVFSSM